MRRIISSTVCMLVMSMLITACDSSKKKDAENVVKSFFNAYKNDDYNEMYKLFPKITSMYSSASTYKSDNITVENVILAPKNKDAIVHVTNSFTNSYGKKFEQNMQFYLKYHKSNDSYQIFDTKNFCTFKEDNRYKFTVKTGCITSQDTTDLMVSSKLDEIEPFYKKKKRDISEIIDNVFVVKEWSWKKSEYSYSAFGNAIILNISKYDLPKPKYFITYYDRKGNVITTDDGYVCYDDLIAGSKKSVSFYTNYVGNAVKANFRVKIDETTKDQWIENYLANEYVCGSEYENYKNIKLFNKPF